MTRGRPLEQVRDDFSVCFEDLAEDLRGDDLPQGYRQRQSAACWRTIDCRSA